MQPAQVIAGRFAVEREAGSGGMAIVFRARDLTSGNVVALKLLNAADAAGMERFSREADLLAEMAHPGIVGYLDHGTTAAGQPYLAMEWLEGETLGQRLGRGALSLGEVVAALRRVADALGHAHDRGVIHRDIKPDNLFLPNGDVANIKLLDFGIARLSAGSRLTKTGALVGTPAYMAPEIIRGVRDVDLRADIFALGCVIFECLTGQAPFQADNMAAVLAKVLGGKSLSLRGLAPDVPPALADLVTSMMARRPDQRPPDARTVARALDGITEVEGLAAVSSSKGGKAPVGLTRGEQRIVCVLIVRGVDVLDAKAEQAMRECGAELHRQDDGLLLGKLPSMSRATDQALGSARSALALLHHHPLAAIAMCTGPGQFSGEILGGEVVEQATVLVRETAGGSIRLDAMAAALLDGHFEIAHTPGGASLRAPRRELEAKRSLLGKKAAFVGRARELGLLTSTFLSVTTEDTASGVLVVAQAGTGKSRLRQEFLEWVHARADGAEILYGAGDSLGTSSPFALLGQALRRTAGIEPDDQIEDRQGKLRTRLALHLPDGDRTRVVAFLGELAGVPFAETYEPTLRAARLNPQLMGDGLRRAWEDWLAAECAAHPVLLVLEDLQWGDAGTVSFVDAALRHVKNAPFMVLAGARPEVDTMFPNLWTGREVQVLRLGPLSRKAAELLIRDALGSTPSAGIVADLIRRADGNPFYLEELIRATHEGRRDEMPDSVLGMVQARLDKEPPAARRVLRAASVFGERFSENGVRQLLGGGEPVEEVTSWLRHLTDRELITAFAGGQEAGAGDPLFTFAHALIRESAYSMLTPGDRVLGHKLAGGWLEQSPFTDPMIMAEHFRRGAEPGRSVRWYERAAMYALGANDLAVAVHRVTLGLEALEAAPDLIGGRQIAGSLRLIQSEAQLWRGELAVAEQSAAEAVRDLAPGSGVWLRAAAKGIIAAGKQGKLDKVESWVAEVTGVSPERDARVALTTALAWASVFLIFGGRYVTADDLLAMVGDLTAEGDDIDPQVIALLFQARGVRASTLGDLGACLQFMEQALAAFEAAGDMRNGCAARANIAFVQAELGDSARAEQVLREALEAADRMGLTEVSAVISHNLGRIVGVIGDLAEAESLERTAVERFEQQGDPRLEGLARTYLAEILVAARKPDEAAEQAERAIIGLGVAPGLRARALSALAMARSVQGRPLEALESASRAYAALQAQGTVEEGESEIRLRYAECLAQAGRTADAVMAIGEARTCLLARAEKIGDLSCRARFLRDVPENARTLNVAEVADRTAFRGPWQTMLSGQQLA